MTVQAMKVGAVEFLTKPFDDEVLLSAIRHAIERSQMALGDEASMRVLRECYASLGPREREVMTLVVSGLLNKLVGRKLGISEITVKAHRGKGLIVVTVLEWACSADRFIAVTAASASIRNSSR
jgi:FixJ family two-component response regulator